MERILKLELGKKVALIENGTIGVTWAGICKAWCKSNHTAVRIME